MADELFESIDRSLESKARRLNSARTPPAVVPNPGEQDDALQSSGPVSGKNKAFIDAINSGNFTRLALVPSKNDLQLRDTLSKSLSFLKPKPKARPAGQRREKERQKNEPAEESPPRVKRKKLTPEQISRNLHLFRGAKRPNAAQTAQGTPRDRVASYGREESARKTLERSKADRREPPSSHKIKKQEHSYRHSGADKTKLKVKRPTFSESSRERDEHDDLSMEVRDLFDLEEENLISYRIGEEEDRQEQARLERLAEQKREKMRYK